MTRLFTLCDLLDSFLPLIINFKTHVWISIGYILITGKTCFNSSVLKADYLQEASLLMAKLCYVEGEYRDALGDLHISLMD